MTQFDFDEWAHLYKTNPVEFELRRKEFLNAEILKSPPEYHDILNSIQADCDTITSALPPLESTIAISGLMADKLDELKNSLLGLSGACTEYEQAALKIKNDNINSSHRS